MLRRINVCVGIQQGNLDLLAPRHGPDFFDFYSIIFDIFIKTWVLEIF
jgi:hypothetical protein